MTAARPKRGRRVSIAGQFIAHRVEMLESLAWASLSFQARRVLDRLEIEHAHHGGKENGRLIVTYDDFARAGIRRKSVSRALIELECLGFIEVTERGIRAYADLDRKPSRYRLTYLFTKHAKPTDEWAQIDSADKLNAKLASIAFAVNSRLAFSRAVGKQKARGKNDSKLGAKSPPIFGIAGGKIAPTGQGAKTPLLSISPLDTQNCVPLRMLGGGAR